jgi:predicted DNA-binding transcriptional regulator AlpA
MWVMAGGEYLTADDLLARFGIGRSTLYEWRRDPAMRFPKPVRLTRRTVRWRREDVEGWEAERQGPRKSYAQCSKAT